MTARRPRNLRKGEPATFRAAWPIEDEDMTMPALIAEATPLLADLLTETGAVITGEATWHIQDAWGVTWLCCQAPATRWDACPDQLRAAPLLRVVTAA